MSRASGTSIFFVTAMLLGTIPLWPVYQTPAVIPVVVGGVIGGAAIALAGVRFRWPGFAVLLVTVGFWLVTGVALTLPGQTVWAVLPSPEGLLELTRASVLGWKQLVTISLPVGTYQSLLVPAFVLVLGSTVLGLSVALRSRHAAWGFIAPAAVLLAGIALGDSRSFLEFVSSPGILVVTLAWYLWFRRAPGPRFPMRAIAGTLVLMLSVGGAVTLIGSVPATGPRAVVRNVVAPPFDVRSYPSALSGYRAYLSPEMSNAVMFEVSGLPAGGRMSIARLPSYDGVVAGPGTGEFQRVPFDIDQAAAGGTPVSLGVRVDAYRGVWVPGVGPLESIAFSGPTAKANTDGFFYDASEETMALDTGGLSRGDAYRLTAVLPKMIAIPSVADLVPGAGAGGGSAVSGVPPELDGFLRAASPADSPAGVRLGAALQALASSGYVSHGIAAGEPFSRSGHGADRLTQLFTAVPMLGDSEQYAVAAALLAHRLGFPARVVVGFAPAGDGSGATDVRGSDISAWIEVETLDGSWLGIDPTPSVRPVPDSVPENVSAANRGPVIMPPEAAGAPDIAATVPLANEEERAVATPISFWLVLGRILGITGLCLAVLVLVLGPVGAVLLAKSRRRRSRQSLGDGRVRARAAWQEYLDASVDVGHPRVASGTRLEMAEAFGGQALLVFATGCDRAAFAPISPSEADVQRLWRESDLLREGLFRSLAPARRLRARASPLTLPAYHYWQRLCARARRARLGLARRFLPDSGPRSADGQSGAARR